MNDHQELFQCGSRKILRSSDLWNPKRYPESIYGYNPNITYKLYKKKLIFRYWRTWFVTSIAKSSIGQKHKIDFYSLGFHNNKVRRRDSKGNKNFKNRKKYLLKPETMELRWLFRQIHLLNGYVTPYS
jgi:hypothetical protein